VVCILLELSMLVGLVGPTWMGYFVGLRGVFYLLITIAVVGMGRIWAELVVWGCTTWR